MMYATKIKMMSGCNESKNTIDIDQIFIEGGCFDRFVQKSELHDYVKGNPGTIHVSVTPYPELVPAISWCGQKYIRTETTNTPNDILLRLPKS